MAFELPPLPYSHGALAERGMYQETLELHHDKHHQAYVTNGNKLLEGTEFEGKTVEEVGLHFVAEKRPSSIIQRLASPEEVANMIVYLCSRQASATTGAALRVDGGVVDTIA